MRSLIYNRFLLRAGSYCVCTCVNEYVLRVGERKGLGLGLYGSYSSLWFTSRLISQVGLLLTDQNKLKLSTLCKSLLSSSNTLSSFRFSCCCKDLLIPIKKANSHLSVKVENKNY